MINVVLGYKSRKLIDPDMIDLIKAKDKYVEIYTEGTMYLHHESIRMILKEYGDKFIEVSRGLIINNNFFSEVLSAGRVYHEIVPIRKEANYPSFLPISRRRLSPVIRRLKELNKIPESARPSNPRIRIIR